jgi:hypothetical protein
VSANEVVCCVINHCGFPLVENEASTRTTFSSSIFSCTPQGLIAPRTYSCYTLPAQSPHAITAAFCHDLKTRYLSCAAVVLQTPFEVHHVHARLPLHSVALGDDFNHVVLYEDGEVAWSSGLPDGLYDELSKAVKRGKGVAAVAMGRNQGSDSYSTASNPDEVWFLKRSTGTTYMGVGCEPELRTHWWDWQGQDRIVDAAFAPNRGWFTYSQGGGDFWQNLPSSLTQDLDENWEKENGVKRMSVGHNGEWFVRYNSGLHVWQGLHPTLDCLLRKQKVGHRDITIEWVELGPDGTFVALFDRHSVWYGGAVLTDHLLCALD